MAKKSKWKWKVIIAMLLCCVVEAMNSGMHKVNAESYGDYVYEILEDGTVEITWYSGKNKEIEIPDKIDGKKVTRIGAEAFRMNGSNLVSVKIPNSVTTIGYNAFWDCSSLKSIEISNSVTSIEYGAFEYCSSLESIKIPDSVTSIGEFAFYGCSNLTNIVVDSGNNVYDSRNNCNAIIEKNSSKLIVGCYKTVIPEDVMSIGDYAFDSCSTLTYIEIPDGVMSIGISAFSCCSSLESIKIPSSVVSIDRFAFQGCSSLTSIIIPASVTNIGSLAFSSCSSVTNIVVDSENPVYSSGENCNAIIKKTTGELIVGCSKTTIPDGVTSIDGAFDGCVNLTNITIPDGVTSIGGASFRDCNRLESVVLPDSVGSIGHYAFEYCSSLVSIKLPASLMSIGIEAFADCSSLTNIEIPEGITCINEYTFAGCSGLESIEIPASVTSIDDHAFYDCSKTMIIYTESGSYAEQWAKKNGFTVELLDKDTPATPNTPEKPDTDNQGQTGGESGSQSTLPAVGTKHTVSNGIYKVTQSSAVNKEVTYIKPKNGKKTSVTIPATIKIDGQTYKVMEVASKAFKNNKNLKSVTIGKNVKKIGKEVFSGCKKLKKITIKSTVLKSIGKNAIKGIDKKATIKCPKKQLSKYKKLFKSKTGYKKTMKIKK